MHPELSRRYQDELTFIKAQAKEFAEDHPKIALRLGLDTVEVGDPYVERLLEGFAFLCARVQLKIDAAFPRFTQHLLECVLPNHLAPVPSMTMVRFEPAKDDPTLEKGVLIPRGEPLKAQLGRGDQTACEFRTAEPVQLWPLSCTQAHYVDSRRDLETLRLPALPPRGDRAGKVPCAGLVLRLSTTGKATWDKLRVEALPLHLSGSDEAPVQLYEQLLAHTTAVVLRAPGGDGWCEVLDDTAVEPVGFADDDALLPAEPRAFQGYRLLREFFAFPQRFRGVRLRGLDRAARLAGAVREVEVVFVFDRQEPRLLGKVAAAHFALFCAPAVNLFPKSCSRIHLEPTQNEFHLLPDRTRPTDFEVHSVVAVTGHGGAGVEEQEFRPLYGSDDFARPGRDRRFYAQERRLRKLSERAQRTHTSYVGTEMFLTLVDGDNAPHDPELKQLAVAALCTNRDLPLTMPVGAGDTDFTLADMAHVQHVRCLFRPTPPRPPVLGGDAAWQLVNHLSLNHVSLVDSGDRGAVALRELLGLYANLRDPAAPKLIDGVRSVTSKPIFERLPTPGPLAFGRGLEIAVTCSEHEFAGASVFLLGAVLEQFFRRYVSINSFTVTSIHSLERGQIKRWQPRDGTRPLL